MTFVLLLDTVFGDLARVCFWRCPVTEFCNGMRSHSPFVPKQNPQPSHPRGPIREARRASTKHYAPTPPCPLSPPSSHPFPLTLPRLTCLLSPSLNFAATPQHVPDAGPTPSQRGHQEGPGQEAQGHRRGQQAAQRPGSEGRLGTLGFVRHHTRYVIRVESTCMHRAGRNFASLALMCVRVCVFHVRLSGMS